MGIRPTQHRYPDRLFVLLPDNLQDYLRSRAGEFYRGVADVLSYDISVKKMDEDPCFAFETDPDFDQALDLLYDLYVSKMREGTRVLGMEEILSTMNLGSSSGVPLGLIGFKKKKDALASSLGRKYLFDWDPNYEPLWRVVGKTEWLSLEEILKSKVRTFIVPPLKFLIMQKSFFNSQNHALKNYEWSYYGFNPYNGGVDRLAQRLNKNRWKFMMDFVRFDRKNPFMSHIYKARVSCHQRDDKASANWVAQRTCVSRLLLRDGVIVEKRVGNNSGSDGTTVDNILTNLQICLHNYIRWYGGAELIPLCEQAVFGDDGVGSVFEDSSHPFDPKLFEVTMRETSLLYGYQLDPFIVSSDLSDMSFLGFQFGFNQTTGTWLPYFSKERILAAFCYEIEKGAVDDALLSKAFSLMVMLWPHNGEIFEYVVRAYTRYLIYFRDRDLPTLRAYVKLGVPEEEDFIAFYTGRESSRIQTLFKEDWLVQNLDFDDDCESYESRETPRTFCSGW